jgi:serine/threonine-protein kinase
VPVRPTRLRAGVVVAEAYTVEHLLGLGASGEVWAARETATGTRFALKVLATEAATDDETVERFRREAYFLRRTQSDHVARIHDFVFDRTTGMALVMELVEGEPLDRALEERTFSVEEAIELGVDLLAGVEILHAARVIHRDLKPGNILLRKHEDGRRRPVICDFGLSRLAQRRAGDTSSPSLTELTKGDQAMGTLRYMAPEQVLNARQATEQSDLYAVGAILYRAVTGAPAFGEHDEPKDIARAKVMGEAPPFETGRTDTVARALEKVVTQAMRRRPAQRFPTATAMREELARAAHRPMPEAEPTERTSLRDMLRCGAWRRSSASPWCLPAGSRPGGCGRLGAFPPKPRWRPCPQPSRLLHPGSRRPCCCRTSRSSRRRRRPPLRPRPPRWPRSSAPSDLPRPSPSRTTTIRIEPRAASWPPCGLTSVAPRLKGERWIFPACPRAPGPLERCTSRSIPTRRSSTTSPGTERSPASAPSLVRHRDPRRGLHRARRLPGRLRRSLPHTRPSSAGRSPCAARTSSSSRCRRHSTRAC